MPISIQSQRFEMAGADAILFPSSDSFDIKMTAIRCYASQFDGAKAAGEIHPTGQDLYELIRIQSAHYGSLIRSAYGEPFFCYETLAVEDVLQLGVQSL